MRVYWNSHISVYKSTNLNAKLGTSQKDMHSASLKEKMFEWFVCHNRLSVVVVN